MIRRPSRSDTAVLSRVAHRHAAFVRVVSLPFAACTLVALAAAGCGNPNGTQALSPVASVAGSGSPATGQASPAPAATLAPTPASSASPIGPAGSPNPGQPATGSLVAMLPGRLAGHALTRFDVSGADFVKLAADAGAAGVGDFLARLGRTPEDLSAAVAFDQSGSVEGELAAIRVAHTSGASIVSAFVAAERRTVSGGISVAVRTIAGKRVTVITGMGDAPPSPAYVYARGDVAFLVQTHDIGVAEAALGLLP